MYTASDVHPNASTIWAVTAVEHPEVRGYSGECEDCLRLANAAIANAAVTGSTGATFAEELRNGGKLTRHSCTVARASHIIGR